MTTQRRDHKKNSTGKMDQENYTWLLVGKVVILQGARDTKTANKTKYVNNNKKNTYQHYPENPREVPHLQIQIVQSLML